MAVTGLILFVYVLLHMIGNLQLFAGAGQINAYGAFLHSHPNVLWVARAVLLASVGLHIGTAILLWLQKHRARPSRYMKRKDVPPAYASGTMFWTGPVIAGFVVFHILHLTTGSLGLPFREGDIYSNVLQGFRIWWVAAVYIIALVALGMHLYHGLWSMFQSTGLTEPWRAIGLKPLAHAVAAIIALGFISIPLAVVAGYGSSAGVQASDAHHRARRLANDGVRIGAQPSERAGLRTAADHEQVRIQTLGGASHGTRNFAGFQH